MNVPCNVRCMPDHNIHVIIDYSDVPVDELQGFITEPFRIQHEGGHLPFGTRGYIVRIEAAAEAPPSPHQKYPYVIASTLLVDASAPWLDL